MKTERIEIRLTKEEKRSIKAKAKEAHLSISRYMVIKSV